MLFKASRVDESTAVSPERMVDTPSPMIVSLMAIRKLTAKTLQELGDWRQFLEPGRAEDLFHKGVMFLYSAFNKVDSDVERVATDIEKTFREKELADGETLYWTGNSKVSIQTCVFPLEAKLVFRYEQNMPGKEAKYSFAGPTQIQIAPDAQYVPAELGYFGPEATYSIPVPKEQDKGQVCGLFFPSTGEMRTVDYEEALSLFNKHDQDDRLVMLNWRLSSLRPGDAINHIDHWIRQPYNGIVIGKKADGSREFAHMTTSRELNLVREELNLTEDDTVSPERKRSMFVRMRDLLGLDASDEGEVSMPEIAANVQVIAKKRGWVEFEVLGTEYNYGELHSGDKGQFFGSSFGVYY